MKELISSTVVILIGALIGCSCVVLLGEASECTGLAEFLLWKAGAVAVILICAAVLFLMDKKNLLPKWMISIIDENEQI